VWKLCAWVPRFVARWHRSRDPFTQGQNITGTPKLEAAKVACERHAKQQTDIPQLGRCEPDRRSHPIHEANYTRAYR